MTEQFNLEKYNRLVSEGKTPKVVMRDGTECRILCTDRKFDFPVVALYMNDVGEEDISTNCENGRFYLSSGHESKCDLFFADPKPTYRPYKDKDECFCDMHRHRHLVRHRDGDYHLVVTITDGIVWLGNASVGIETKRLLEEFTFVDGTPCGVKEE